MKRHRAKQDDTFSEAEDTTVPIDEYERELELDPDDLDGCLVRQGELIYHINEQLSYAIAKRDELKLEVEEVEADEDNKLRALAEENEERVTEPFIKKQIAIQPKVQRLRKALLAAKKKVGRWEALKEGFTSRSIALSKLVDLHLSRSGSSSRYSSRDELADDTLRRVHEGRRRDRR